MKSDTSVNAAETSSWRRSLLEHVGGSFRDLLSGRNRSRIPESDPSSAFHQQSFTLTHQQQEIWFSSRKIWRNGRNEDVKTSRLIYSLVLLICSFLHDENSL